MMLSKAVKKTHFVCCKPTYTGGDKMGGRFSKIKEPSYFHQVSC